MSTCWPVKSRPALGSREIKSACIIFDDVEIDLAIEASIASAFKLSGQRCVSSGRMIVQRSIYHEFSEKFAARAKQIKTGNPFKSMLGSSGCPDGMVWEEKLLIH